MTEMASNLDSDHSGNTECADNKFTESIDSKFSITEAIDSKFGITDTWNAEDEWTTEMKFELINLVRDQPALWDHNCADNKNRDIKQGSLAHIAYTIGKPEAECQRVWNTLRSSYARELNKLNSGKKKTKWQFLDVMSFLHDVMSYRKPALAMSPNLMALSAYTDGGVWEVHDDDAVDGDVSYPTETTSDGRSMGPYIPSPPSQLSTTNRPPKRWSVEDDLLLEVRKKFRKDGSERSMHPSARATALMSNGMASASVSDQCEKFGQYIASSLCGMLPKQRAQAQLKIQQVLYCMSVGQSVEEMPPMPPV